MILLTYLLHMIVGSYYLVAYSNGANSGANVILIPRFTDRLKYSKKFLIGGEDITIVSLSKLSYTEGFRSLGVIE